MNQWWLDYRHICASLCLNEFMTVIEIGISLRSSASLRLLQIIAVMVLEHYSISNHWQIDCLFKILFRLTKKKMLKLCITGPFCVGSPNGFPSERSNKAERISRSWYHVMETNQNHWHQHCCRCGQLWLPLPLRKEPESPGGEGYFVYLNMILPQ